MADSQAGINKGYLDGNSISPNELHVQYGIPHEEIISFRNLLRVYPNPEVIIREGDREQALYLLRVGTVEVFKGQGTSKELIGTIDAVNFFGEMSMINDEARSATVISMTNNVVIYKIPNPNIQTILTNPKWAELLISRLSRNLARSHEQHIIAAEQIKVLRSELERVKKEMNSQQAESTKNTLLAFNGLLHFQGIVQRTAVVGSKGWAYLNTLDRITRSLISYYFPNLDETNKTVEINVIQDCLAGLPQDEQHKVIEEFKQLL
jgi:CRP-like cAMP-binding protein